MNRALKVGRQVHDCLGACPVYFPILNLSGVPFRINSGYINVTLILLPFLIDNEENEFKRFIFSLVITRYFCFQKSKIKKYENDG